MRFATVPSWGCEIDSRVDFDAELDRVITKKRVSPFYRTTLEQELRQLDVNAIAIAGVATNNAPDLFAREAWDRDFKPTIITDACGAASDELHDATLASLPPVILKQTTQKFLGCL
ncbi:MAG: cysteine hydrolase [Gammaproteobacteria bacterium]|nr:cysteine hydrolase [Gammaproteobacteria bacterium]